MAAPPRAQGSGLHTGRFPCAQPAGGAQGPGADGRDGAGHRRAPRVPACVDRVAVGARPVYAVRARVSTADVPARAHALCRQHDGVAGAGLGRGRAADAPPGHVKGRVLSAAYRRASEPHKQHGTGFRRGLEGTAKAHKSVGPFLKW